MKYWTKRELVEAVMGKDVLAGDMPEWLKELEAEGRFEVSGECMTIDVGISSCHVAKDDFIIMKNGAVGIVPYSVFINGYEKAD